MASMGARRLRGGAAILIAAVIVLVWDWWQANREIDRLLDTFGASETAMVEGMEDLGNRVKDSTWAALDLKAGVMDPGYVNPLERDQALQEVRADISDASSTAMGNLRTAAAEIEQVSIMPWHRSLGEARDAYLDHNEAWIVYLRSVAADPTKLGDNVLGDDIDATFRIAERRAEDSLPWLPLNDAAERVEEIFAE